MYACGYVHKKDGDGLKIEKLHCSDNSTTLMPRQASSTLTAYRPTNLTVNRPTQRLSEKEPATATTHSSSSERVEAAEDEDAD